MTASLECVIDTNIAVKQFISDPLTEKTNQLFTYLDSDPSARFFVPDLFYIECANVLRKYVRANLYPADLIEADLVDLKALRLISIPTKALMVEAAKISSEYDVSAYDGSYVALSHQAQVPFLTLDKRLRNSLIDSSFNVQLFTNFEIPSLP